MAVVLVVLRVQGVGVSVDSVHRAPDATWWATIGLLVAGLAGGPLLRRQSPRSSLLPLVAATLLVAVRLSDASATGRTLGVECAVLASQLLLAAGFAFLARRRSGSSTLTALMDGIIVGLGAWMVLWVFLVRPTLGDQQTGLLRVVGAITPGVAVVVLFLLATMLFSETKTTVPVGLLGLGGLAVVGGVLARAITFRESIPSADVGPLDAPFIGGLLLCAAAYLHPAAAELLAPGRIRQSPPLLVRLTTITASLAAPIVVLALTDPVDRTDRVVRTVSACVLVASVMTRIVQSVLQNARTQEHLRRTALTDALTGLANRTLMLDHVQNALETSHRTRTRPTVLFIDVDHFKTINDSLGHATGDGVLTEVASRLVAAAGDDAVVARISGDEFVVLDETTESPTQSVILAERMMEAFRRPIDGGNGDMFVTASIGVAYATGDALLDADTLMRHADAAMYRAKNAGRNCISLFDESMLEGVSRRLNVETALYRALERGELRLVHQPILDLDIGVVVGFEALMRWDRGAEGNVPPSDFIPIAEETGTIVPLGSWALRDALTQLRAWIDAGVCRPNTTMSVNVSPRQLHDPHFVSNVSDALHVAGLRGEQLWLEVTESLMITEPEQALASLRQLNALGVRVAIDDFGTGYSSLSVLQQFPVQCIKIDRSFVQDLASNEGTRSIVRTIVAMARTLGAEIVAEGVESPDQVDILRSLDCSRAQGYLISAPVEAEDVPHVVGVLEDLEPWTVRPADRSW